MEPTEKLLAEIEAGLEPRALADFEFLTKARTWLPKLVKMVREQAKVIELANSDFIAQRKQLADLRDENYSDLLEQMDEAWGPCFGNVRGEEVRAFLDSRRTHKPTNSLRKQLAEQREDILELLDEDDGGMVGARMRAKYGVRP